MLLKGPLKVADGAGFLQSGSSLEKIIEMWMCLILNMKLKLRWWLRGEQSSPERVHPPRET